MRRRLIALPTTLALAAAGVALVPTAASARTTLPPPADLSAAQPVPGKTKVSLYVGLDRPEKKARKALRQVSDPTSPQYRHFPSRNTVAKKYGASSSTIAAARKALRKYGLSLHPDPTRVFARVSGTAKQMKKWVGVPVLGVTTEIPGGEGAIFVVKAKTPRGAANGIREFYGRDFMAQYGATASRLATANPPYDGQQSGTPKNSCIPQISPELDAFTYSINELRTAYGLDALPSGTKVGKATRVAIVAQGDGFSDQALDDFEECFSLPPIDYERIDVRGLSGTLPEGGEGDLDVQVVRSVLPAGSKVDVVQTFDFDGRDFLTWSTVFGLDRRIDAVTTSYGLCEPLMIKARGKVDLQLTESVFRRLGLAGTSIFSAAGDRGSSDCVNNETGKGNTRLAVNFPGSSSLVTSVGGTRIELTPDNQRANEVVWFGPKLQTPVSAPEPVGGGGGSSILFDRPWWQPKSVTHSQVRTVPDIAAHASPVPGWPVVTATPNGLELMPIGGTSAATPFTAATIGLLAANERLKGRPSFGHIQAALYHLASTKPSTFYDVQTGNNDVFGRGCCSAEGGYDKASGLGAIRFDKLAKRMPKKG